jgi:hypothetical protein
VKQKDYGIIGLVIVVSAVVSLIISNKIFETPTNQEQSVTVVGSISTEFTQPSGTYFNKSSIDPTEDIVPYLNANSVPFGNSLNN